MPSQKHKKNKSNQLPVTIDDNQLEQLLNQALAFHHNGQLAEAQILYRQLITHKPNHFDALKLLGVIAIQTKDYLNAVELLTKAIAINSQNADAYYNLGLALQNRKDYQAALDKYNTAIALKPDFADAYNNSGIIFQSLNDFNKAIETYDKALLIKPDAPEVYNNRGFALRELKRHQEALQSYDKAITLKPDYADAYSNRGVVFRELNQFQKALDNYDQALALKPGNAQAYNNRCVTLQHLKLHQAAFESINQSITLKPDYAEAYFNRANSLLALNRKKEALKDYDMALTLMPNYPYLFGKRLYNKMYICDWGDIENQVTQLALKIQQGEKASDPMPVQAVIGSLQTQRKAAEIYTKDRFPPINNLAKIDKHSHHKKIRIGYFSADFRDHPVSYLTAELFEIHDRSKFEVTAFSFGINTQDAMRLRLEAAFDNFIDVQHKSDNEVVLLARQLEIDIAIDLVGYTGDCRAGIFALRAAPIQVSYIGYLGTMGAEFMDYLLADPVLIPDCAKQFYTEKIVYLPSYQANDSKRLIADRVFSRQDMGLPEQGFVFCCFNANYKITPVTFDGWMRILQQVDNSVLFLLADNEEAENNLKKEAELRGINGSRIIFAKRLPRLEYLARYRCADLFLDTLPYNAGATASDALWAGLPVLTCMGEAFASRVAASLLTAIHLPELITTTQADYEAVAIELATNPNKLNAIKNKLQHNRLTTPLFDSPLFTRNLETAFNAMYKRYQADLPPVDIYVKEDNGDSSALLINNNISYQKNKAHNMKVLNVGGNTKAIPLPKGYEQFEHLLLDIDPRGSPDIICDARQLTTLAAKQFHAVYCSHNLEHYYRHDVPKVLAGFLHVLTDDGFAHIRVPDIYQVMKSTLERNLDIDDVLYHSPSGPIMVLDVLYGYSIEIERSGQDFYAHKTGFTQKIVIECLAKSRFQKHLYERQ